MREALTIYSENSDLELIPSARGQGLDLELKLLTLRAFRLTLP